MKIALYSDLHHEIAAMWEPESMWEPPPLDVDVVLLAGDISSRANGVNWAASSFAGIPVVYVSGNHEFYGVNIGFFDKNPALNLPNVHFLDCATYVQDEVRFLGCTLWSSFELRGQENAEDYMLIARNYINDYRVITGSDGDRLRPEETRQLHKQSVTWLERELARPFAGKTVVVTHFAPHPFCVAREHRNSDVSPYFVNDLRNLINRHSIALWAFGHTHANCDFTTASGCRVISNQLGYPKEQEYIGFQPGLIIEV
jgi:predicted phosphodiesterase